MIQNKYTALVKGEVCPYRSNSRYFVIKEENGYSKWNRLYYISEDEIRKMRGSDELSLAN